MRVSQPITREQFLAANPTRAGVLLFSWAVLAGPWYTVDGYSVVSNSISELAAQNTPNNFIMRAGFLALGFGILVDGARRFRPAAAPFLAFALFLMLAGLFSHRPIAPTVPYSTFEDNAHSALATLAGLSITIALLWHGLQTSAGIHRTVTLALAFLCIALPMGMLGFPEYQGVVQRLMYSIVFVWLWFKFPRSVALAPSKRPVGAC